MGSIGISGGQLRHLPLQEIVRKAGEYGVDSLELQWGNNLRGLQEVESLKPLLEASHMTVDVLNSYLFRSSARGFGAASA